MIAPALWCLNEAVADSQSGSGTAYYMREDVFSMFAMGGMMLVIGGVLGLWRLRKTGGSWAQRKASFAAAAPYLFLGMYVGKGLLALPFLASIYDISKPHTRNTPIAFATYQQVKSALSLLGLLSAAFLIWRARHRYFGVAGEGPRCQECGYDLTGNTSGVCPECGCRIGSLDSVNPRK